MSSHKNIQGRKWQLTINNPLSHNLYPEAIKQKLFVFNSLSYFCFAYEIGLETGTEHVHIYFVSDVPIRFSTIKKRFPAAHIERTVGTSKENRDYIRKEGRWENDPKKDTSIPDSFFEWGELPTERQGERSDLNLLYEYIKDGLTDFEILERCPMFMLRLNDIARARMTVRQEQYKNTFRNLEVAYIFGPTGTGKTRGVMEKDGYSAVYRVTDYNNPFDGYNGQEVLVLDEYRSQLKISEMLNILDGYPLELRCRYSNKIACFTKVYIISNIELKEQYSNIQVHEPATWEAFLRRIHKVIEYFPDGHFHEYPTKDFLTGFREVYIPEHDIITFRSNNEPNETNLAQNF